MAVILNFAQKVKSVSIIYGHIVENVLIFLNTESNERANHLTSKFFFEIPFYLQSVVGDSPHIMIIVLMRVNHFIYTMYNIYTIYTHSLTHC
jgi:hypothetical protein